MNGRQIARRVAVPAIVTTVVTLVLVAGCGNGPIDWEAFDQRTIEENLASMDSAGSIYKARLDAGDIDAAAAEARAFLLTQPGVTAVKIPPDSSVWAFFANGLLAGLGDEFEDTTGSAMQPPPCPPEVRAQGGGELGPGFFTYSQYFVTFDWEHPQNAEPAKWIAKQCSTRLGWGDQVLFLGSKHNIDLGFVRQSLLKAPSFYYWFGHGKLFPTEPDGPDNQSGLVLPKGYWRPGLAEAAVNEYFSYLKPGPGKPRLAAVVRRKWAPPKWFILITPAFVREFADFDHADTGKSNLGKTMVILSTCHGAFSEDIGRPGDLMQAFLDKGADLVFSYSWVSLTNWSGLMDTELLDKMMDGYTGGEAYRMLGNVTQPGELIRGRPTVFQMWGDENVMLQSVCDVDKDGEFFRNCGAMWAERQLSYSRIITSLAPEGTREPTGHLDIWFAGSLPGVYEVQSATAWMMWDDVGTGRQYRAWPGYVGVGGGIAVNCCQSDAIIGGFSGTLGYWEEGYDPLRVPPEATVTFARGQVKFIGKVREPKQPGD